MSQVHAYEGAVDSSTIFWIRRRAVFSRRFSNCGDLFFFPLLSKEGARGRWRFRYTSTGLKVPRCNLPWPLLGKEGGLFCKPLLSISAPCRAGTPRVNALQSGAKLGGARGVLARLNSGWFLRVGERLPPAQLTHYLLRAGVLLLAAGLVAAVVRFQFIDFQLWPARIAALAIGLVLGAWRLRYGIFVLVVTAPLVGIIPRSLGIMDLSLPEHMLLALLLCGAVRRLWVNTSRPSTAIDAPLLIFTAVVVASAAWALWEYHVLGPSMGEMLLRQLNRHFSFDLLDTTKGPFLVVHYTVVILEASLWFVLLTFPGTELRAGALRNALVLSAVAVGLVGVAQAIFQFGLIPFFQQMQPGLIRINSTLPDPNTLGSFLVLLFPLGVVATLQHPSGRWPAIGWIALLGYCLIRSVSRTAWIAAGAQLFAVTLAAGWRPDLLGVQVSEPVSRGLRWVVALALPLGAAAVLAVTLGWVGRGVSYTTASSPADMLLFTLNVRRPMNELVPSRIDHWHAAINIWRDFPVFGAGIGKYSLLKGRYLPEARERWMAFTEAHNYYLKILSEMGVVGLLAFLVVLGSIGVQARRAWTVADKAGRQRVAAAVLGLAGFLVASLGQDPLTLREMQIIFWAVVALLVLEAREAESGACTSSPDSLSTR